MKANILTEWNNLEMKEAPVPDIIEGECLIKVNYAGICGSDLHIFKGHHPTAKTPVILGHEFTGIVEKINSEKSDIEVGDRVVVEPLISCGMCEACSTGNWHVCKNLKLLGIHTDGGFAEYVKVDTSKVIKIGDDLSDRVATLTEPFAVGFHVNQRAGTKNGDNVLVIGGGPIGLVVGMVARISGANQVVFSEINSQRVEQIRSFGFTAINPAEVDALAKANELTADEGFNVVFEVSGSQAGTLFATEACSIRGTIVPVGFPSENPEFNVLQTIFKELTVIGSRVYTFNDFKKTVKMLENIVAEEIFDVEKLISDTYQLADLKKGLEVMEKGENLGKILIKF